MSIKEYVNLTEFALRCHVSENVCKKHVNPQKGTIKVAKRFRNGYLIDWEDAHKPFIKAVGEAKLVPKRLWTPGKMLDLEAEAEAEKAKEPEQPAAEPGVEEEVKELDPNMPLEELAAMARSNISHEEAKRLRDIVRLKREILDASVAEKTLVDIAALRPLVSEVGVLVRKSLKSIRPRVAAQFASMTDQFAIGRMLDIEIDRALNIFDRFSEKLRKGDF